MQVFEIFDEILATQSPIVYYYLFLVVLQNVGLELSCFRRLRNIGLFFLFI